MVNCKQWDYVFLFSNEPVPGLVEKVRCAVQAGRRVVVVYFARPWKPLSMDTMSGATVFRRVVTFDAVNRKRVKEFWPMVWWLKRYVFSQVTQDCDVYADALDLLAMAEFIGWRRQWRFRFEVRDLHGLQLGRDMTSRLVRSAEQLLLKRVHTLVLTSQAHHRAYYQYRYCRTPVVVHNIPDRVAWKGFARRPSAEFTVGFVGVLRYPRCLKTLIDAARRLNEKGLRIRVRLAGGGLVEQLRAYAGGASFIEISGPFRYRDSARHLFEDLDLIYSVYDADDENVRLAIAGKYYEAQIAGIPLLVAGGTYLATLVRQAGFGETVRHADAEDVAVKIEEAYLHSEWYESARRVLAGVDVDSLFARHDESIQRAVLDENHTMQSSPAVGIEG